MNQLDNQLVEVILANWRLRNHYDCSIHGFVNRWSKFKESTPFNNVVDTRKQHQRRSLYFVTCNSRCRWSRRYRLCVKSTTTFWSRLIHYYLKSRSRLHDSRAIIHIEGKNEQECNYRDGYSRESNLVSQSISSLSTHPKWQTSTKKTRPRNLFSDAWRFSLQCCVQNSSIIVGYRSVTVLQPAKTCS